jgi:hypothetical protein
MMDLHNTFQNKLPPLKEPGARSINEPPQNKIIKKGTQQYKTLIGNAIKQKIMSRSSSTAGFTLKKK